MRCPLLLPCLCCLGVIAGGEPPLPERSGDSPASRPTATNVSAVAGHAVAARLRAAREPGGVDVWLSWTAGDPRKFTFRAAAATVAIPLGSAGGTALTNVTLEDAVIECPQMGLNVWTRPNPAFLPPGQEMLPGADGGPPRASEHWLDLLLGPGPRGVDFRIEGCHVGCAASEAPLKEVAFRPAVGAEVAAARLLPLPGDDDFLCLDLSLRPAPAASPPFRLPFPPGANRVAGIPVLVAERGAGVDPLPPPLPADAAEDDARRRLSRSPFDGLRETIHFSVPLAQYVAAWVLCAAEDNPAGTPLLAVRLTRYATGGRGDALADSLLRLPRPGAAAREVRARDELRQAGVIAREEATEQGAAPRNLPLWLAEVPLKAGAIQDLIFFARHEPCNDGRLADRRYLDLELSGRPDRFSPLFDPACAAAGGVHVFGVTLERTPVEMEVRSTVVGHVFQEGEPVVIPIALRARRGGRYILRWTLTDIEGRTVGKERRRLDLPATGIETVAETRPEPRERGWHAITFVLENEHGRRLAEHPAALAVLPPDTRRAGRESPYFVAWPGSAARGTDDPAVAGPLMLRAGLRHTSFDAHRLTEKDMAPWKVGAFHVPWLWRTTDDPAADAGRYARSVSNFLSRFPGTCRALVPFPSAADAPDADVPSAQEAAAASNALHVLRTAFPALAVITPHDLDDDGAAGEATDTAGRRPAAEDIPAARRQAEAMARRALKAHAAHRPMISFGRLHDPGDAGFHAPGGSSGLCRRYPLLHPKPAYVACATLTRLLDEAAFTRRLPCGSEDIHVLEFTRADNRPRVYAVWSEHGPATLACLFEGRVRATLHDIYGRSRDASSRRGRVTLKADRAPCYLEADRPLTAVRPQ